MQTRQISGVTLSAIQSVLPEKIIGESFFSELYGEKEVARIVKGTGIGSVRSADKATTTSDMISTAAKQLLAGLNIDACKVDGLIVVTQTPDDWSPGTAFAVHHKLELAIDCFTMDINAGCAGYVNGLIQAASLVAAGVCRNVLLCTGDINTRLLDDMDHQVRMLFGDAASATLVTRGDDTWYFSCGADGSGRHHLGVHLDYAKRAGESAVVHSLKMDGAAVMSFALRRVPETIKKLLKDREISKDDVDIFALHQPNEFILNYIRKILEIDEKKLPIDVDGIGNTNSSSIPVLLSRCEANANKHKKAILCGFGVGFSWNSLMLDLSKTIIAPPMIIG